MLRLLLVRHGQSTWNAERRWQGEADPPLSELGRQQAIAAAQVLGTFDAVYASPQERALITAELIANEIGVGPVQIRDDLRERAAGEWSGLTRVDIEERYPGFLDDGRRPPGYESDEELHARVSGALEHIHREVGTGEVVVFTHGGVIYSIERALGAQWERMPNVGARWLTIDGDRMTLGERVFVVDDGALGGGDIL